MADILQDFPIAAPPRQVFAALSTPEGLDQWWTVSSIGTPSEGAEYTLDFGPEYQWRARVVVCVPDRQLDLEMTTATPDWLHTVVGFQLQDLGGRTWVQFRHVGWAAVTEHYRTSAHCWALYLRILRRFVEHGERVPYAHRLNA